MGQDMVIYRIDNGVGTVKSKVWLLRAFTASFNGCSPS